MRRLPGPSAARLRRTDNARIGGRRIVDRLIPGGPYRERRLRIRYVHARSETQTIDVSLARRGSASGSRVRHARLPRGARGRTGREVVAVRRRLARGARGGKQPRPEYFGAAPRARRATLRSPFHRHRAQPRVSLRREGRDENASIEAVAGSSTSASTMPAHTWAAATSDWETRTRRSTSSTAAGAGRSAASPTFPLPTPWLAVAKKRSRPSGISSTPRATGMCRFTMSRSSTPRWAIPGGRWSRSSTRGNSRLSWSIRPSTPSDQSADSSKSWRGWSQAIRQRRIPIEKERPLCGSRVLRRS